MSFDFEIVISLVCVFELSSPSFMVNVIVLVVVVGFSELLVYVILRSAASY